MILRSVVFPEPLAPISPIVRPGSISAETSRSAQKSSALVPRSRRMRSFRLVGRSW